MTTITDQLFSAGAGIITKLPEVRDLDGHFFMADDGGVECEVGEFLYGLIRVCKAQNILETGTYTGISAMYMAQALKDNGFGTLYAVEYEQAHIDRAIKLWSQVGVKQHIESVKANSTKYSTDVQFDFLFLDSEPNIRWEELERFFPNLKAGGFIGIHDVPRSMTQGNINPDHPTISSWPFGDIPPGMANLLKSGQLVKFHLPTPRGLVMFYKPHPDDHQLGGEK